MGGRFQRNISGGIVTREKESKGLRDGGVGGGRRGKKNGREAVP